MVRLTSVHVPIGVPQPLHDMTVSSVGVSGISSRPLHLSHLNLLTVAVPPARLRRIARHSFGAARRTARSEE
jgi:hypothetical protein